VLARYLAETLGVTILRNTVVHSVAPPLIETSSGPVRAAKAIVAAGDDFTTLFPERIEPYRLTRCKLHMLRAEIPGLAPLPGAIMTDLSLVRYLGYAELPEAAALRARLEREQPDHLAHGIHLIAVQSADGSLVLGDSHHYSPTPDPFQPEAVDTLILDEARAVFGAVPRVTERWLGTYASATDRLMLVDRPSKDVRVVIVTSGTGASTAFAIAEEVLTELTGTDPSSRPLPA
jgi:FAD dependent oxidoreductase TIGR03364